MAGTFAQLITEAEALCDAPLILTEGTSWEFAAWAAIDGDTFDFTDCTCRCEFRSDFGGEVIMSFGASPLIGTCVGTAEGVICNAGATQTVDLGGHEGVFDILVISPAARRLVLRKGRFRIKRKVTL